jgi:enoyl-CoA hydratase
MTVSYETIQYEVEEQIATVTLNRPGVLNALNAVMFDELEAVFTGLVADKNIRVVLMTGAGNKAFAAGADIKELARTDRISGEAMARRAQHVFSLIESCGKPVIACIHGFALGGGCELALACTIRLAGETARLGQPEVKLGLMPGYGGTQRLPRMVGQGAAMKLLLAGEAIPAPEALRIGLVDEVVLTEELMTRAWEMARSIAVAAPLAVKACMDAVRRGNDLGLHKALPLDAVAFGELCGTADKAEGTSAFLAKRKAIWSGR